MGTNNSLDYPYRRAGFLWNLLAAYISCAISYYLIKLIVYLIIWVGTKITEFIKKRSLKKRKKLPESFCTILMINNDVILGLLRAALMIIFIGSVITLLYRITEISMYVINIVLTVASLSNMLFVNEILEKRNSKL